MTKLTKEAVDAWRSDIRNPVALAVADSLLSGGLAEIEELRNSVANAETAAVRATLRAEKAEGELACMRSAKGSDDIEIGRQWGIARPYLDATTNGKTWGEIIKLYAEREKSATAERDAARAEIAAMREKPAEPRTVPFSEVPVGDDFFVRLQKHTDKEARTVLGNDHHGSPFFWTASNPCIVDPPAAEPKPEPKSDWRERFHDAHSGMAFDRLSPVARALLALRDGIDEMRQGGRS